MKMQRIIGFKDACSSEELQALEHLFVFEDSAQLAADFFSEEVKSEAAIAYKEIVKLNYFAGYSLRESIEMALRFFST